jgi:hypothetical protein
MMQLVFAWTVYTKAKDDYLAFWLTLYQNIQRPPLRNEADRIVSETTQKCNLLNSFFTSQSRINDVGIHPPVHQIRTQSILDVVEVDEVRKAISELKTSKANGTDGIIKFIKTLVRL